MADTVRTFLADWETFFFLLGSAAAGLTGLQFIVIALIAESRRRATIREIQAFSTPTIVHFAAVLLVSAILIAPWRGLAAVALLVAACGAAGLIYAVVVAKRARRQATYRMVFEDWLWHVLLPFISYGLLLLAGVSLGFYHRSILVVAASTLLLMFVGIHNAWDAVTYITTAHAENSEKDSSAMEAETETE